ncbi:hypothetical protein Q0M94_22475 (plasmid) [Deinococcus radiomollis]|uniref:hypothetical protein n=1 Tax=Deinococcus radiomollis TaxID=468916 RepID=UPI003892A8C4
MRERLASLLWPEVLCRSAPTNLRRTLSRLRSSGAEVVTGDATLTLAAHVRSDAAHSGLSVTGPAQTEDRGTGVHHAKHFFCGAPQCNR